MNVRVKGGTKSKQKHVKSMVEFISSKLMPRIKDLDIKVKFKDLSNSDAYGFCLSNSDGNDSRTDRPRTFEIELHSKMKLRRTLEVLAHEMVHVKQYARGELYVGAYSGKHRWQGKWVSDNINYWDAPWEIEAHGRESGLFIQYADKNELGKFNWTQQGV
jgi:hypothetical protein